MRCSHRRNGLIILPAHGAECQQNNDRTVTHQKGRWDTNAQSLSKLGSLCPLCLCPWQLSGKLWAILPSPAKWHLIYDTKDNNSLQRSTQNYSHEMICFFVILIQISCDDAGCCRVKNIWLCNLNILQEIKVSKAHCCPFPLKFSSREREDSKRNSGLQVFLGQFSLPWIWRVAQDTLTSKWSAEQMFLWGEKANNHGRQVKWLEKSDVVKVYDSLSLVCVSDVQHLVLLPPI